MIHTMEVETTGADNMQLTEHEASSYLKKKKIYGFYDNEANR